jgi:hypothetical protein
MTFIQPSIDTYIDQASLHIQLEPIESDMCSTDVTEISLIKCVYKLDRQINN